MINREDSGDDDAYSAPRLAEQAAGTAALNAHYEELAFDLGDGDKGNFLSGWQCANPFTSAFFARVRERANHLDFARYTYFDEHVDLAASILALHTTLDGASPQSVVGGAGTTSLLFAFVTHLKNLGTRRIFYIPPLYITLYSALDRYGIETIPVAARHAFEPDFELALPEEPNAVLLLTDPTWYAGRAIGESTVEQLRRWQDRTGSLIFVDGSLQYLKWSGDRAEATARLDPRLTIRLVCPSKQLSAHGYRFSYMLVPESHTRRLAWAYTNVFGPACVASLAFAHEAVRAIADGEIPIATAAMAATRHAFLRREGVMTSPVEPNCGYFVFERLTHPLPENYVVVDGKFFRQPRYPGHIKLNLLSPSLSLVSETAAKLVGGAVPSDAVK
jgi:histidinol-phosphate/aromatic aminotransferase/cobyric acid decarboxylase-like protein